MKNYEDKTKEELLQIIKELEKKIVNLSTNQSTTREYSFREKCATQIFDVLPDMLTILDHSGNVVELVSSPSTNHIEDVTEENFLQSNIKDFLPEEAYKSVRQNMEKVIHTGQKSASRHDLLINGVIHHFENRIFPLDDEYLLCICPDVSEQWETEQVNLKQQNEIIRLNSLMDAIINNVPVALFIKDASNDFRYLYWNKTFAESSGIPIENAIGKNDFELFSRTKDMEKFRLEDFKVLKEGKVDYIEEYQNANGEIRATTTMKRLVNAGSKHPYIIGISWDITDIKRGEKELNAARIKAEESDRLKSAFLANMSHEIRTPLNAIVGFAKLILDTNNIEEKKQYTEIIERNSEVLLNLFRDILDLSSLEAGSLKFNIQPNKLLDICLQQEQHYCYKVKKDVKLILDESKASTYVSGDWDRIMQVIGNLLSNALKFTFQGEIHFGYQEKENFVEFYVKDTGIGITAERVATIFQRFGKVNDFVQGTGLGLAISRMLVEKMGGHIWLRSTIGKGTIFYFTLPLAN